MTDVATVKPPSLSVGVSDRLHQMIGHREDYQYVVDAVVATTLALAAKEPDQFSQFCVVRCYDVIPEIAVVFVAELDRHENTIKNHGI